MSERLQGACAARAEAVACESGPAAEFVDPAVVAAVAGPPAAADWRRKGLVDASVCGPAQFLPLSAAADEADRRPRYFAAACLERGRRWASSHLLRFPEERP